MNKICLLIAPLLLLIGSNTSFADSRCTITEATPTATGDITCSYKTKRIRSSFFTKRDVLYETPTGTPPTEGWPVVLMYQGSNYPIEFTRTTDNAGIYEVETIQQLLDHGYAVIVPRPLKELVWMTNALGPFTPYTATPDYTFLKNIFHAIRKGKFGPINPNRKYATGMSSGGYNVSRMAISFQREFRSLAIHSASYANCLGPLCVVPPILPRNHPPTLFIHGDSDGIVPWFTMDWYYDTLLFNGITTERYTEPDGGHTYFEQTPHLTLDWFERNP